MKESIIINLDGEMTDVALVDDRESGVYELYETQKQVDENGEPLPPEQVLIGYRVSVPVPQGLYKPKWDMSKWDAYIALRDAPQEYTTNEAGESVPVPKSLPNPSECWIEGRVVDTAQALAEAQAAKKAEVSAAVGAKIVAGYQSATPLSVDNIAHFYSTNPEDQTNMSFEYSKMNGNPSQETVEYRPQDALDFITHTRDEFKSIAETIYSRTKFYMAQGYAYYREIFDPSATLDSVNAIVVTIDDPPNGT